MNKTMKEQPVGGFMNRDFPDELDQLYTTTKILGDPENNEVDKVLLSTLGKFKELEDLKNSQIGDKITKLKSRTSDLLEK